MRKTKGSLEKVPLWCPMYKVIGGCVGQFRGRRVREQGRRKETVVKRSIKIMKYLKPQIQKTQRTKVKHSPNANKPKQK